MPVDRELTMRIGVLERKVADLYRMIGEREPGGAPDASGDGFASSSPEEDPGLLALVSDGRMIEAIKVYRDLTGAGLKEAKKAVERLEQLHRPTG